MPEQNDNRIEEWKSLRDELARKQSFCETIALGTVGANLGIYAYAMKDPVTVNSLLALILPPFLGSIAYYWLLTHVHSGRRIAYHLRCELEDALGIKWERTVEGLRGELGQIKADPSDANTNVGPQKNSVTWLTAKIARFKRRIAELKSISPYSLIMAAFYVVSFLASLWCIVINDVGTSVGGSLALGIAFALSLVVLGFCAYHYFFCPRIEQIKRIEKRACKDHPILEGIPP